MKKLIALVLLVLPFVLTAACSREPAGPNKDAKRSSFDRASGGAGGATTE